MKVTHVHLRIDLQHREGSRLRAMGSVTLDGVFQIEYVKVVQRTDGTFLVAMPSRLGTDGSHHDVAHPVNKTLREHINDAVMSEYNRLRP